MSKDVVAFCMQISIKKTQGGMEGCSLWKQKKEQV